MKKFFVSILCLLFIGFADYIWVETTQEDFSDGIYERNIYASHLDGGTVEFTQRLDLNNDGYIDLITSDISGPYVKIYWGSDTGYFQQNVRLFPTTHGGGCAGADLNNDDYCDLLVTHWANGNFTIYWGNQTGPDSANYSSFDINGSNTEACFIVDFDKDGYLDILVGDDYSNDAVIFWGSSTGYSSANCLTLPANEPVHNLEVADLNQDGWHDMIIVNRLGSFHYIYWNSESGFNPSNRTDLPFLSSDPHGCSVADLNKDGFLDIIFTGYYTIAQSYIYWGSETGYSPSNYQILNSGRCYGGSAVYDFNDDNYLDIIYFRGSSYYPNERPIIYWGSQTGFSNGNTTEVGNLYLYASGGLIADLNYDGEIDIFINNHEYQSYILWGPGFTNYTSLPVNSDHHAMCREIGNVYNRDYYEDYISSVFDAGAVTDWGTIEWDDSLPEGSSILFWVRSGNTAIPDESWTDWCEVMNGDSIPEELNAQYLQYKARLAYINPAFLPTLYEVRVSAGEVIPAWVRFLPRVIYLNRPHIFAVLIRLPEGYDHDSIDVSTVVCEGAPAIWGFALPWFYIALFRTQDLIGVSPGYAVELMVTGQLYDSTPFCGYGTVCVIGSAVIDDREMKVTAACRPNPCRERTTIIFSPENNEPVSVKIYDINGALVRTLSDVSYHQGVGSVTWDRRDNHGRRAPAGVYFYKIHGENIAVTKKVVVLE